MHRLIASGPRMDAWIAAQSPELAADWLQAVAAGLGVEALAPMAQSIVVCCGINDWDVVPPRLSLDTAIQVLRSPLAIVCEDRLSDKAFVTAIVPPNQREWFDILVAQAHVTFEETGSIDKFDRLLEWTRAQALRGFAIMDSDAMVAGYPSRSALRAVNSCTAARVRHHRLAWRFAESYLSARALWQWCDKQPHRERPAIRRRIEALHAVPADVRNHFNMKHGDTQDRRRLPNEPSGVGAAWNAQRARFSDDRHAALAQGFGGSIAEAFHRDHGVARGAEAEAETLFASIRSCL